MKKVGIIGGGAAGIFCAITVKQQLKDKVKVTILERQARIGKKILQTGSGKCNLTNINIDETNYNTASLQEALKSFTPEKCISLFHDLGILTRVDDYGRVYPYSERATTVLEGLMHHLNKFGVEIICDYDVTGIKKDDKFICFSKDGFHEFDYLVLATGGQSSVNFENHGYDLAKRLGHSINAIRPGLVAMKTKEDTKPLRGIRVKADCSLTNNDKKIASTSGEVQFRNDGLSGIAILDLSRFYKPNVKISLDLVPEMDKEKLKEFIDFNDLETSLLGMFPKMIAIDILKRSKNKPDLAIDIIKDYKFEIVGLHDFKNAQVTIGGIDFKEVSLSSYESLKVKDLYIIGEVLNIDGACGGYNLHFAWMSGYLSAHRIVKQIKERGLL